MSQPADIKSISVVIPIYKDDVTLKAILQNLQDMDIAEIIIADGEARPNTPFTDTPLAGTPLDLKPALTDKLSAKLTWLAAAPKGRGTQIHAAIARATCDYIWILHADTRLDNRAPLAIQKILEQPQTSLGTFTLKFDTPSLALTLFAWLSKIDSPLTTFGDQGFFFRREDYNALDLDLAQYPLLEDVALRRALKRTGRITRSRVAITTSARRFAKRGIWATQAFNTLILWRYLRGESPSALYLDYYQLPVENSPLVQKSLQI